MYFPWNILIKTFSVFKWFAEMFFDLFNKVDWWYQNCISGWFSIDYFRLWNEPQISFRQVSKMKRSPDEKWSFSFRISLVNETTIWSHLLKKTLIENFIFCAVDHVSWIEFGDDEVVLLKAVTLVPCSFFTKSLKIS